MSRPESFRVIGLWLRTAFRSAPRLFVLHAGVLLLAAIAIPLQTYGVKLFVDGIASGYTGQTGDPDAIRNGIAIIVAGLAITLVAAVTKSPIEHGIDLRAQGRVHRDVLELTTGIPGLEHHERSDVADRLELTKRATNEFGQSTGQLFTFGSAFVNFVVVLGLLVSVQPFLAFLVPLAGLRVWSHLLGQRWYRASVEQTTPNNRLLQDLGAITKEPRHGLEVRVFGLRDVLLSRMAREHDEVHRVQRLTQHRAAWLDGSVRVVFGLCYLAAIGWVITLARQGGATAGDVTLVVLLAPSVIQATGAIGGNLRWMAEMYASFEHYLWLHDYARDHKWADGTAEAPTSLRKGITLHNIGFSYQSQTSSRTAKSDNAGVQGDGALAGTALSDVNLHLPAGTSVALVGENGAGKSTLVKLLARLYDPTSGSITIDDVELRRLRPESWRARVSSGFQDFVKFEFLAREAVGLGDLTQIDDPEAIAGALDRGDAKTVVGKLPRGLDTQLGVRFEDGVDLSGGEWQRLALARAFMRTRPLLLLLDEPTAALDPEAEHALYERFAEASTLAARETGGITVLVSHRFSTVRMADLIVVLYDGRIAEAGSHEELLAANGRYAELFEMQASAYR